MGFTVKAQIGGLGSLLGRLDALGKKIRNKTLRKAVGKAARIVAKSAKKQAPVASGLLKKSIGSKVKTYKSGVVVGIVGPRSGYRQEVERAGRTVLANPSKYAHLVELGTSKMAARPFLAPALEATAQQCQDVMAATIAAALEAS